LTRKRLLAEALGLLDRDGFEASTIRHLADHLGASPTAPYNHASSKQDLLQGIAQQMEVIEVALLAIFRPMEITLAAH
jgi:AcrR family transcriptional regulator